jgi:glycosyltransferase involved in cell wall biosynthesis
VLHRTRALLKLGHEIDLVTYPFGTSPELPGLRIVRAARPPGIRDVRIGPSFAKIGLDVPLFAKAAKLARSGGYDLLHTHEEAGVLGAWLARSVGIPHVYDMHSSLPQQFANFGRFNFPPIVAGFRAAERYTLAGADGVIVICPDLLDHVQELAYPGRLELIENTLDFDPPDDLPTRVENIRERFSLAGRAVVLYTGTLERYQGLDLLVSAAPEVIQRLPNVVFLMVGGTADQVAALKNAARALSVDQAFEFVGSVSPTDVFAYLEVADVLVTTRARGTNTPLKIYQYLRAGKPIVATAIRSHTQALDSTSAELVPPEPMGIAKGLIRTLTDHNHAHDLATGARRLADTRYSERVYMERLERLMAGVVNATPRAAAN